MRRTHRRGRSGALALKPPPLGDRLREAARPRSIFVKHAAALRALMAVGLGLLAACTGGDVSSGPSVVDECVTYHKLATACFGARAPHSLGMVPARDDAARATQAAQCREATTRLSLACR